MAMGLLFGSFFGCFILCPYARGIPSNIEPPVWPASYMAKGVIDLPYAEIGETFEIWYDGKYNRSRIDYYSGTYIH